MIFVRCYFKAKLITLFVYKEYLKRTFLCRSGNSEGLQLFLSFHYFYLFFIWQNKFFTRTMAITAFSPLKSLSACPFSWLAFLQMPPIPRGLCWLPYTGDLQFPARSFSQMEKWCPSLSTVHLHVSWCPRLRLPCVLVCSECLDRYLVYKCVLSKCKHLQGLLVEFSLLWKEWVGHNFAS